MKEASNIFFNIGILLLLWILHFTCSDQIIVAGSNRALATVHSEQVRQNIPPGKIKQLCAQKRFFLILTNESYVYGSGSNFYGQLDPFAANKSFPLFHRLPVEHLVKQVECTPTASILLTHDGVVLVIGQNSFTSKIVSSHLLLPIFPKKLSVPVLKMVATDNAIHLATRSEIFSIGMFGSTTIYSRYEKMIELPSGAGDIVDIAAGSAHVVVLTSRGQVFTAGDNYFGQRGVGNTLPLPNVTRIDIPNRAISIHAKFLSSIVSDDHSNIFVFGGKVNATEFDNIVSHAPKLIPSSMFRDEKIVQVQAAHDAYFVVTEKSYVIRIL